MSGLPEWNYPAFDAVAEALESVGYSVVNPANHFDRDTTRDRADYIRQSLHDVETVDALALLSGWEKSEGAQLEFEYARQLGIPAYTWQGLYTLKSVGKLGERVTEVPDTRYGRTIVEDPRVMPGEAVIVPDDFYEPDEPVEDVVKAYHEGEKAETAKPVSATYGDVSLFCGDRECTWCQRNGYVPVDDLDVPDEAPNLAKAFATPRRFRWADVWDKPDTVSLLASSPAPHADEHWAKERNDILNRFRNELAKATGDGSKKRQAGEKPPWYRDDKHEAAIFSHLNKWKHGEKTDADSGAHTLVHLAWRALAIACQETGNIPEEEGE